MTAYTAAIAVAVAVAVAVNTMMVLIVDEAPGNTVLQNIEHTVPFTATTTKQTEIEH